LQDFKGTILAEAKRLPLDVMNEEMKELVSGCWSQLNTYLIYSFPVHSHVYATVANHTDAYSKPEVESHIFAA